MRVFTAPEELCTAVGERLGISEYRQIDQSQIDSFGQLTGDKQWIHTDPVRAGNGPFGSTVAHGFFTLALLIGMLDEIFRVQSTDLVLNKGLDRVRFSRPVPVGAKVRAVADLVAVASRPRGFTEAMIAVSVEIEGERRPAYTARQTLLFHRAKSAHGAKSE